MISGRTKTLTWGKRIIIVLALMAGLGYGVLALAERSKEPVRRGMEDALSQITDQKGTITEIATVKMVPDVVVRMNGILVRDKNDASKTLAHADKAYFSMPTWRMFLSMRQYAGFEIQGLELATGYIFPKKLSLDSALIADPDPIRGAAHFVMDGIYNGLPLLVTAELERKQAGTKFLYSLPDLFPVTFKLGQMEASGLFERGFNHVSFKQVQIVRGDRRAEFVLKNFKTGPARGIAEGTIENIPFNGALSQSGDSVIFTINPKTDKTEDLKKVQTFVGLIGQDLGLDPQTSTLKLDVAKAADLETEPPKSQETDKK